MTLPHSVCEVLRDHVVLESECIDRMYLNVYVPQLQRIGGVVWYLRGHLGQRFGECPNFCVQGFWMLAEV